MIHNNLLLRVFGILAFIVADTVARKSILGGDHAEDNEFPYQVSLKDHNGENYCGGGIIGDQFILTAAHCAINKFGKIRNKNLVIVAGTNNMFETREPAVIVRVKTIFIPSTFKRSMNHSDDPTDDIAVLKLGHSLGLSHRKYLKLLKLPKNESRLYVGEVATIAGFGWDSVNRSTCIGIKTNDNLLFAEAVVQDFLQCRQEYFPWYISNKQFCARVKQRPFKVRGACKGDSGSPLVHNKTTIIGILTAGVITCSEKYQPGLYISVSHYLNFIERAISGSRDNDIRVINLIKDRED